MILRKDIVEKGREYINTPFHHQGRVKGVGVDCAGFIICLCKELNIDVYDVQGYNRIPTQGIFLNTVENQLIKIDIKEVKAGDIMIFHFGAEAQHIALVSEVDDKISIIHAYSQIKKVVEHDLDELWTKRLCGCYRFKNIEE